MSATTPAQQPITHIDTGAGYGGGLTSIKSYSEFMLNKMMFDKILNAKNSMEFTPTNIGKLMLIMCAPDIKTLVIEAGKYLASIVKECPQYIFTVLKYIYNAIQSLKRSLVYCLSGKWVSHRKPIDFQPENMENSVVSVDMWQTIENYSLTVDSIFTAELITFIQVHKHTHIKSCISMNIEGVNITRQYMLSDAVINWTDDTNQPVQISINNNISFSTTAKLTNSANETLVNLYELPSNTSKSSDEYVFPSELGFTEYWDLLSNPIFKETYPCLNTSAVIVKHNLDKFKNTSLRVYFDIPIMDRINMSILDIYSKIHNYIAKQNFKVYGIPNANPDITTHCLTLLMIYMHLGCESKVCCYKSYEYKSYTINPFLININLCKFIENIRQQFIQNDFVGLMTLERHQICKVAITNNIDMFWAPVLKYISPYNSKENNNIVFDKSKAVENFYIPLILSKKLDGNHVTQERFDKFMTDNNIEKEIKAANETNVVSLDILLKTKTPNMSSAGVLAKFIETIRANSVSLNTKCMNSVPVKYIKLKLIETTTESDNPAYKEWVKKKDLILSNIASVSASSVPISNQAEISNSNSNSNSNGVIHSAAINSFLPSLVDSMPTEKLVITTTKLAIDEQTINQTCRQMQSLSLKSKDKKKLMHALDDYLEDGPTLKAWGIKNKLNILLYGEPGTGKSSTIEAIATYLNKPIYYVDMKEARTNNDLKLIFDHVNSVAVGGGIIVMEDIDAMTDCVHKRISYDEPSTARNDNPISNTTNTNTTVSGIMTEKETNTLTLEFFLNILDGVLTADKSIFITTTNHIEKLDPAFHRAGRFNLKIELGACNYDQMNYIYKNMRGHEIPTEILASIPDNKFKPAEFIFQIKDYVRDPTLTDAEILEPFMTG
jgi:predicted GTPase